MHNIPTISAVLQLQICSRSGWSLEMQILLNKLDLILLRVNQLVDWCNLHSQVTTECRLIVSEISSFCHEEQFISTYFQLLTPADAFIDYPESLYSTPVCSKFTLCAIIRGMLPRCLWWTDSIQGNRPTRLIEFHRRDIFYSCEETEWSSSDLRFWITCALCSAHSGSTRAPGTWPNRAVAEDNNSIIYSPARTRELVKRMGKIQASISLHHDWRLPRSCWRSLGYFGPGLVNGGSSPSLSFPCSLFLFSSLSFTLFYLHSTFLLTCHIYSIIDDAIPGRTVAQYHVPVDDNMSPLLPTKPQNQTLHLCTIRILWSRLYQQIYTDKTMLPLRGSFDPNIRHGLIDSGLRQKTPSPTQVNRIVLRYYGRWSGRHWIKRDRFLCCLQLLPLLFPLLIPGEMRWSHTWCRHPHPHRCPFFQYNNHLWQLIIEAGCLTGS